MYFKPQQQLSTALASRAQPAADSGRPSRSLPYPELELLARVELRLDAVRVIGDTPDGVRFAFTVHGDVDGTKLRGKFPSCMAHLRVDRFGVGTIHVRAPLLLADDAVAELEATGRYDFGTDGYRRALAGDLPNSALGWAPRFLSADARYAWLNRVQCLGLGELRPREKRVQYDLYVIRARLSTAGRWSGNDGGPQQTNSDTTLIERVGGEHVVARIAYEFVDALDSNVQLNRQNPRLLPARMGVSPQVRRQRVADAFCNLFGGSCNYTGRPLPEAHRTLEISEADWVLAGAEFVRVLDRHEISKPLQQEVLAAVASVKSAIVTRS